MKTWICVAVLLTLTTISSQAQRQYPYPDPRRSPERRVEDLLSRMTLEEKVAQLRCVTRDVEATDTLNILRPQ